MYFWKIGYCLLFKKKKKKKKIEKQEKKNILPFLSTISLIIFSFWYSVDVSEEMKFNKYLFCLRLWIIISVPSAPRWLSIFFFFIFLLNSLVLTQILKINLKYQSLEDNHYFQKTVPIFQTLLLQFDFLKFHEIQNLK